MTHGTLHAVAIMSYVCGTCRSFNGKIGPCSNCGQVPGFLRPPVEAFQIGMIDGETSGYYGKAFPKDPKNPSKRIVPNKAAWREHCKRTGLTDVS